MVTKFRNPGDKKTGRVKVGRLKLDKETVKDLSATEISKVKGGAVNTYMPMSQAVCKSVVCGES